MISLVYELWYLRCIVKNVTVMLAVPLSAAGKTPPLKFPLTCLVELFAGRHENGITRKGRVLDDSSTGLSVGEMDHA